MKESAKWQRERVYTVLNKHLHKQDDPDESAFLISAMKTLRNVALGMRNSEFYNAIVLRFFADTPLSIGQIAARTHRTKRTVYKDIDAGTELLAGCLFGIDGFNTIQPGWNKTVYEAAVQNTYELLARYYLLHQFTGDASPLVNIRAQDIIRRNIPPCFADKVTHSTALAHRQRTATVLDWLEKAVEIYRTELGGSGDCCEMLRRRRYRIIMARYIDGRRLDIQSIAENEDCEIRNVYKDIKSAAYRISQILFEL